MRSARRFEALVWLWAVAAACLLGVWTFRICDANDIDGRLTAGAVIVVCGGFLVFFGLLRRRRRVQAAALQGHGPQSTT